MVHAALQQLFSHTLSYVPLIVVYLLPGRCGIWHYTTVVFRGLPTCVCCCFLPPDRFIMPGVAEDPMADSPWYGFDFGPVHFTIMSTEHDFSPGSTQVHSMRSSRLNLFRQTDTRVTSTSMVVEVGYGHLVGTLFTFYFLLAGRCWERASQNHMKHR